jgi:futalosine hydrolase
VITRFAVAALWPLVATPTPVAVATNVAATTAERRSVACMHLEYRPPAPPARVRALLARFWHEAVAEASRTRSRYGPGVLVIAATNRELDGVGDRADSLACGIGPVEAAVATTLMLARLRPTAVLHVGIAGARGFVEPELVLGDAALYCDAQSPLVPATAAPDAALLAAARAAFPHARVALIGTSARVGGTTDCAIEAMEGFAVLRACELAAVPALEVRVTSNDVDEPDRARWRFSDALELLRDTLPDLIEALDA